MPSKTKTRKPVATAECVHRWICGEPMDGIIPAGCLHCGAERTFENYPKSQREAFNRGDRGTW